MIQPVMKTPADRQKSIQLQWFVNRETSVQLITVLFNDYNVLKYAGKMSYTKEIPKFIWVVNNKQHVHNKFYLDGICREQMVAFMCLVKILDEDKYSW